MIYVIAFCLIYLLHVVLKLNGWIMAGLVVWALFMIPKHRRRYETSQLNQKRFNEVSLYLDTILYAFVKEEKVFPAVRDVRQTLPEGEMKTLVEKAHDYMEMTFDEVEVLDEALGLIDKEYPCKRIRDVHKFMTHVEYYGGEIEKPVMLLLADKSRWEKRLKEAIADRRKQFTDVLLSVVASLIICGAILYLPVMDMDISTNWLLQILSLLVIVADDLVIYRAQKYLAEDWIQLQLTEGEDYYVEKMESYQNYDMEKEKHTSLILGAVGLVITLILWLLGRKWLVVIAMGVTLLFMNQHQIGRALMEKTLSREIKYAFPNWLLDLVLLLQSENVQVALQKSREYVPGVLRKELFLLTERLQMQPESSEPYHMFLKGFAIPEIHSAMGMLFSLSIGNSGNADKQISELVDKNLELLDITETQMLKKSAAGMYVLFLVPMLTASFKLVADLMVLMFQFMQMPVL